MRTDPRSAEAHAGLAICYAALNRPEDALAQFREASALEPSNPTHMQRQALILHALGRHDEASALERRANELSPFPALPQGR